MVRTSRGWLERTVGVPGRASTRASRGAGLAAAAALAAQPAGAQIAGLPVLQSPFTSQQVAVAVNGGNGGTVKAFGAAAAWTPASGRVQVSGGVAQVKRDGLGSGIGGGARVYLPLKSLAGGAVAVGILAGGGVDEIGGTNTVTAPVGAAIGYRRGLGATRALSVYAVPFYRYTREKVAEAPATKSNVFRVAAGGDVVIVPRVALTVGIETGAQPGSNEPGIRSSVTGVGLSYSF